MSVSVFDEHLDPTAPDAEEIQMETFEEQPSHVVCEILPVVPQGEPLAMAAEMDHPGLELLNDETLTDGATAAVPAPANEPKKEAAVPTRSSS